MWNNLKQAEVPETTQLINVGGFGIISVRFSGRSAGFGWFRSHLERFRGVPAFTIDCLQRGIMISKCCRSSPLILLAPNLCGNVILCQILGKLFVKLLAKNPHIPIYIITRITNMKYK